MEIDLEISGAITGDWMGQLRGLVTVAAHGVTIDPPASPSGTFGAGGTRRAILRNLATIAQLASILSAATTLYVASHPTPPPPQPALCHLSIKTGTAETVLRFVCGSPVTPELVQELEAHAAKHGMPDKVKLTPPARKHG